MGGDGGVVDIGLTLLFEDDGHDGSSVWSERRGSAAPSFLSFRAYSSDNMAAKASMGLFGGVDGGGDDEGITMMVNEGVKVENSGM